MTGPLALEALKTAALEADSAERRFRATMAEELVRLETARRRGFRRYAFLKALVDADAGTPDLEASLEAQRRAASQELDWDDIDAARRPVLDALEPLAEAIFRARERAALRAAAPDPVEPIEVSAPATTEEPDLLIALAAFEVWYEGLRGKPFVELFDRYAPETPVVDF